jgi:hypothetical protein
MGAFLFELLNATKSHGSVADEEKQQSDRFREVLDAARFLRGGRDAAAPHCQERRSIRRCSQ